MSTDDTMLDELLGAYALDAVGADEAVAVEAYLERAPHAAQELARLRNAAAWICTTPCWKPPGRGGQLLWGAPRPMTLAGRLPDRDRAPRRAARHDSRRRSR